jgi:hypothetical protein
MRMGQFSRGAGLLLRRARKRRRPITLKIYGNETEGATTIDSRPRPVNTGIQTHELADCGYDYVQEERGNVLFGDYVVPTTKISRHSKIPI